MQNSQMEARAEGPGCERTAFTKTAGSLLPLHGPFAYRRWLFDNLTRPRRFTRQGYCATCAHAASRPRIGEIVPGVAATHGLFAASLRSSASKPTSPRARADARGLLADSFRVSVEERIERQRARLL